MPWKTKDSKYNVGATDKIAPIGKMFTYRDLKYPATWSSWDNDYKVQMELYWENEPTVKIFDKRFYNGVNEDGSFIDKDINNLKAFWISKTKTICNDNLQSTDWYAIRKADAGTAIPDNITKYRADTRTASKTIEDKITACSSVSDIVKLFDVPKDGVAPIYDFPKLEDY